MRLIKAGEGSVHQPPLPNAPVVTVVVGGDDGSTDIGFIRIRVAAGAAMVPHRHNGSDIVLTSLAGAVRISKGTESYDVGVGDTIFIGKDEEVGLANVGEEAAELIVAAGPAKFVNVVAQWPEPRTTIAASGGPGARP